MTEFIQVITTVEKKKDAEKIGKELVQKRFAPCAQVIGPLLSTYWWKGSIEGSEEWYCIIKTKNELFQEIEKAIKKIHPYEVPEIIAIPIIEGSKDYLAWMMNELKR